MDITPLGHASFKIRGKHVTLVTDPFVSDMVGLKFPKHTSCDIVTVSHEHEDHSAVSQIEGSPFVVSGPGEYEIKGVGIVGLPTWHDAENGTSRGANTIYRMEIDKVVVAHLGDLGHILSAEQIDELDGVDILCIPVGGIYTLGPKEAAEVIGEIEPKIVIPMHYGRRQLKAQSFGKLAPVGDFLKEIGKEAVSPQVKLTISKDKLPTEMQVVVLE